jgi:3-(3-hydroxy-phenyl)propionate hydroxylase
MGSYAYPVFAYRRSADQDRAAPAHHKAVVVGGGLVGLTAALDLAQRGVRVLLVDDDNTVSVGSRSICQAKRTLEIWDRLGAAAPMMDKGVTWQVGRIFCGRQEVYSFDLLPEGGHRFPAFINLQQYYVEQFLLERIAETPDIELRWQTRLAGLVPRHDGVRLTLETQDGRYDIDAEWVIAADGARSTARRLMSLDFKGRVFEDRFLIADIRLDAPPFGRSGPTERWFWFEPEFHRGDSALLHRQADNVWRLDFQLGWNADPELERQPERVARRVKAALGETAKFEFEWLSVYTFQCRRLERFRHGRVLFAGDAAHQVSPFGARGGNSGVQDADNLCWKLALVIAGEAPEHLLDTYHDERSTAADENIRHSSRSTDFMTPKTPTARSFRDAVLDLARTQNFARRLINSGRLSTATVLDGSPLNTPDIDPFPAAMRPGSAAADAPVTAGHREGWLLEHLRGGFHGLYFAEDGVGIGSETAQRLAELGERRVPVRPIVIAAKPVPLPPGLDGVIDRDGLAARRYDGRPGTFYLLRPDQHVAARWRALDPLAVIAALKRATAQA